MKILISGSNGLLGNYLSEYVVACGHEYRPLKRSAAPISLVSAQEEMLDSHFDGIDYFIHTAANTNVENCEINPRACYRDNLLLTEIVANAARRRGVPMVFISSTGVYGSHRNSPWAEYDETHPVTHHHRSKLLAEQRVISANSSNLVIRTGWLFGGDLNAPKNFVAKRIQEGKESENKIIYSNNQQYGSPTNVKDLAARVLQLITLGGSGIFNVVNSGFASRFEYVEEIMRIASLDVEVRPVAASEFDRVAPVSNNEMAFNWRADSLGLPEMRNWKEALIDYIMIEMNKLN